MLSSCYSVLRQRKNCLKLSKFGNNLISMAKLLQFNSFSKIEKNVCFSENIILEHGCRQGGLISLYLFVLSAEILSIVIRECGDVNGLRMGLKMSKTHYMLTTPPYFYRRIKTP